MRPQTAWLPPPWPAKQTQTHTDTHRERAVICPLQPISYTSHTADFFSLAASPVTTHSRGPLGPAKSLDGDAESLLSDSRLYPPSRRPQSSLEMSLLRARPRCDARLCLHTADLCLQGQTGLALGPEPGGAGRVERTGRGKNRESTEQNCCKRGLRGHLGT